MAYTTSTLLVALMLVATASVAHCSLVINGTTINVLKVDGSVICKCNGTGVEGVAMSLSIGNKTVATGVTTGDCGEIMLEVDVNVDVGDGLSIADICVTANIKAGTCTASSPAKVVTSPVSLIGFKADVVGSVTANVSFEIDL